MFNLAQKLSRSQISKRVQSTLSTTAPRYFAGGPVSYSGRLRVVDEIVWLNVIDRSGLPKRMAAYEGQSLISVLQKQSATGIYNMCDGGDETIKAH